MILEAYTRYFSMNYLMHHISLKQELQIGADILHTSVMPRLIRMIATEMELSPMRVYVK